MRFRGVLFATLVALAVAGPASGMRWLDDPGHVITASDFTTEATGPTTNVDYFTGNVSVEPADETVTCSPAPGSAFPVGSTQVDCTADDADPKSINVIVTDTTPPQITSALVDIVDSTSGTGVAKNFTINATDLVDGSLTAVCAPASGSTFPIGSTLVTCTATDAHTNPSAPGSFHVNIGDTGVPTISVSDATVEATGPTTAVNFSISASDNSGVAPAVDCAGHGPGSLFPVGSTPVTCKATDGAGNFAEDTATITVNDTTAPTVTVPSNISVEANSAAGKTVTYSASATDLVAGSVGVTCTPASGSTFGIGTTPVSCSATDGHSNTGHGNFTVTVTDTSGPTFSSVSPNVTVEANGPAGSIVNYPPATAVDGVDGPLPSSPCSPASGSTFALGTTVVTCTATDVHGNTSTASFTVSVVDTTKPTLLVPIDSAAYANTPTGLTAQGYGFAEFLGAAQASDLVDPSPHISNDAGEFLTIGVHVITFSASDASGNIASKTATFEVRPMPPAATPPLPTPPTRQPPANVTGFKAVAGDGRVQLSWQIPAGVDHVVITRALTAGGDAQQIYTGSGRSYVDRGVANGLEYRYLIVSVDRNGDRSTGVAAVALPKRNLLRSPKDGAKLKKPPKLMWAKNSEAAYYNVQLFRGNVKILSIWPVGTALTLKRTWKYQGRRFTLTRGTYRWYVWPGFGARAAVDYGELLGARSFQMTR